MKPPPAFPVALVRLMRRDGLSFFGKCARYAFSPSAWRWLLHGGRHPASAGGRIDPRDLALVRSSEWFDADWYLRNYPDVLRAGVDPAAHYLRHGREPTRNPGPDFVGDEYLALNDDVRSSGSNPLVHFERFGKGENRRLSFSEAKGASPWPDNAVELEFVRPPSGSRPHRRVAVFAAHSGSARVPESTLIYLRGLREVADEIVFVGSNPVLPGEADKLDGLVRAAVFRDHGGYDFYSYKIGWEKARGLGLLDPETTDEFILANDSCYAPVFPLADTFAKMSGRACDFWGMTSNTGFVGTAHIQSYFLVFRRPVLDDGSLSRFLDGVVAISDRWEVVRRYEAGITAALAAASHGWDTLVPRSFAAKRNTMPTKLVLETMTKFGMPLVKAKALNGDMADDRADVMDFIRARNPELAAAIPPAAPPPDHGTIRQLREAHPTSFADKIAAIHELRIARGLPVRALFLVSSASMFPARPLFDAMRRDSAFDARILVVPDLRWRDRDPEVARRACRADLGTTIPADRFLEAAPDEFGLWPDSIGDFGADIVCYPSPYDLSSFRYNPHWAVGRPFLPIHANYGFYRSIYDREVMEGQNYAYFWKAFFECDATAREYAEHSILRGANAEVVGYVKMDALASAEPWPRNGNRKRVLIAPHHSVEGGTNDTLALSNFQRYADFFLSLPERHPELDFAFRPHPFLFTVLSRPSKWGPEKVGGWIARMKAHPNVRWSEEGDYFPVFASCDACVQDCGSYLVEWLYTGKPCCYMLKAPSDIGEKFAPLGKDCLSHCYLAYDEAAIESFLRDVVEGGADPKAAARDEFRRSVMVNHPHAADAALAGIRRSLGMV